MKNKIGWCDMTWNPVWGCNNHCEYCYARGIAKRFWTQMGLIEESEHCEDSLRYDKLFNNLHDFKPTFLYSQFEKKLPKKPQRVFVGSMSEIKFWKPEWIRDILNKVLEYPQHTFQFLTKFPDVYSQWYFHPNCWLGVTITKDDDFDNGTYEFLRRNDSNVRYISFEPLLGRILSDKLLKYFDWIIIGAETGNRKGKVIPSREWIDDIVSYCKKENIPVYLKDSLKNIYPVEIKKFPEVRI